LEEASFMAGVSNILLLYKLKVLAEQVIYAESSVF
jgi:hypothetical protein